ncbi:hypothetical protein PV327_004454 [Microctonus hyperodae]|uniref:G-protein coupled receptors family 2 profile 2 domain-containing protein n=1 Tax=Microctonus hyperodae TaxID=165561 RepID=A0AA39FCR4_MICHY|nr:hypothetical protein PV327_004454 [Microctonus hyperodae]
MFVTIAVILFVPSFAVSNTILPKCCHNGFKLDDMFQCTVIPDNITTLIHQSAVNETALKHTDCFINNAVNSGMEMNATTDGACTDSLINGTVIILSCMNNTVEDRQCDSLLKVLDFWGASMVILATILYTIPYVIIVILYCAIPTLRIRAYDKSVVAFNASYVILNCLLIFIGSFELCHKVLPNVVYGILGLIILFLTQASVLWLFIICFDMTSVITRFHWAPDSDSRKRDDKKKFRIYSTCVWGMSLLPTVIAMIMEFNSFLPQDSLWRPNFSHFHGNHNISLVIYTILMPVLVLLTNTILFIYTTYKMIKIQRENAILNIVKNAKKKYFLYLKLYLIMDAPWLSGALSAIYPNLWALLPKILSE